METSNQILSNLKIKKKSRMRSRDDDKTITAMAAKSSGLDNSDNILVKTEYSDLVQEL